MKNRCFSLCCALAVTMTGVLQQATASAETEPAAEVTAEPVTVCEETCSTDDYDPIESTDSADTEETLPDETDRPFVSFFPAFTPAAVASYNPVLHSAWVDEAVFDTSTYYTKGTAVLLNGTLYAVGKGKATVAVTDVADFTHLTAKDEKGVLTDTDIILKKDGRIYANGNEVTNSDDLKPGLIQSLDIGYGITEKQDGNQGRTLYAFVPFNGKVVCTKMTDSFECFLPDQKKRELKLFYNGEHCIYSCSVSYNQSGSIFITLADVGIYYPVAVGGNLYLDYRQNLYRLLTEPKIERIAVDNYVVSLDYIGSRDGYKLYSYTQTNNRSYEVLSDTPEEDPNVLLQTTLDAGSGKSVKCTITKNRSMNGVCGDKQFTVTNVETVLHADIQSGQCCVYFLRTDGSIWMYNFGTKACTELAEGSGSGIKGDLNGDGKFDIKDVNMLQRWINSEDGKIVNWKCGDINKDNQLDAVDLALMKRDLIH